MSASAPKRPLFGPVLTLMTGSSGALALAYLARPVLTRLYTPEAFGIQGVFLALVLVLNAVSSLRYEDALQLPRRPREGANVAALAVLFVLISTVLTLGAWPFRATMAGWFREPGFAAWVIWLPVGVGTFGLKMVADNYLVRQRRYRTIAQASVAGALVVVGVHVLGGLLGLGPAGLILGSLCGYVAGGALAWTVLTRANARLWRAAVRWPTMRQQARRYRRFPRYTTLAALLGVATQRMLFLGTPLFFSMTVTGFLTQAVVVLATPLGLVSQAINQAFVVEAAALRGQPRQLAALTAGVHQRLVAISLYPTGVVLVAGPDLFGLIFGEAWVQAGVYLQVLAPWLWLMHIASPLTRLFDVLERQHAELAFGVVLFGLHGSALLLGGLAGDIGLTLLLFSGAGVLARALQTGWLLRAGGVGLRDALRPYVRYALRAVVPLAATAWATSLPPLAPLLVATLGALIYYGWLARDEGLGAVLLRRR